MTRDTSTSDHTNRRTILHALGGLGATGALVGTSTAAQTSSDEIDYADLDAESKAIFEQLLTGDQITRQGNQLPTDLLIFNRVRYDSSVYRIQRSYSKEATYHVAFDATSRELIAERVRNQIGSAANSVDEHINAAGKISKRDLPAPTRRAISIERDRTPVEELPREFIENTYLQADGTLYRILAGHADITTVTFTATQAR